MIGQMVGRVFRIDYNTETTVRGKFARIAVEIPLDKPLVSQFVLDGKVQRVEYDPDHMLLVWKIWSCGGILPRSKGTYVGHGRPW